MYRTKPSYDPKTFEIRIKLPIKYRYILLEIEQELGISRKEIFLKLLELYYVDNYNTVEFIRRALLKRISKGINRSFVTQLKLLYTTLGHFLKKIKELK